MVLKSTLVLFCSLAGILVNSSLFNFYQCLLFLLVRPFNRKLYRKLISELIEAPWVEVVGQIFPNSLYCLTGQLPTDTTRPCVIIANHQVDADWWYIWQVAKFVRNAGNIKVVLKGELKNVPIIGWGMQFMDFIFLDRNLSKDKGNIERQLKSFEADEFPSWIVLFPEGTTVHQEYVEKSKTFSKKTGRPEFDRLLLPRTAGLEAVLKSMECSKPDVFDLTLCYSSYSGEIPTYDMDYDRNTDIQIPSLSKLLAKHKTEQVHIHGEKCSYDEVMTDIEKWIDGQWQKKEAMLQNYIKNQVLTSDSTARVVKPQASLAPMLRLWMSIILIFLLLPLLLLIFFPCYTIWVVWTVLTAAYDQGTNKWLPFLLESFSLETLTQTGKKEK